MMSINGMLVKALVKVTAELGLGDVRRVGKEILRKHFPGLPEPKFKIVRHSTPDWLGRAVTRWNGDDQDTTIEIHKSALSDRETLHRVLCHELIHHWQHCNTSAAEESKKTRREKDQESHGDSFLEKAAELNKKYGKDYVTIESDDTYVLAAAARIRGDTLKAARGDDNLLAILRIDADDAGKYWETKVFKLHPGRPDEVLEERQFRHEQEARDRFDEIQRKF